MLTSFTNSDTGLHLPQFTHFLEAKTSSLPEPFGGWQCPATKRGAQYFTPRPNSEAFGVPTPLGVPEAPTLKEWRPLSWTHSPLGVPWPHRLCLLGDCTGRATPWRDPWPTPLASPGAAVSLPQSRYPHPYLGSMAPLSWSRWHPHEPSQRGAMGTLRGFRNPMFAQRNPRLVDTWVL